MITTTQYRGMRKTKAAEIEQAIDGAIARAAGFGLGGPITISVQAGWERAEIDHVLAAYRVAGWRAEVVTDTRERESEGDFIRLEAP